ncbi:MAG: hypothetical protein LBK44_03160 [Spirochaetales bacterium]|jgi:uroporphyrinogen-III decarboxylase|nr:hypothetical protein [Spirochaetales bacterium]
MPSLSPRENFLRALNHEETEYVPFVYPGNDMSVSDIAYCGFWGLSSDVGNADSNFIDGFGVPWEGSESTGGAVMPAPGKFILKDVTQWKKSITIPNLENYDLDKMVADAAGFFTVDRDRQALAFMNTTGVWNRLAALMGFEEALVAILEEPEACNELFTAITDYKVQLAEKAAKYFKPDIFYAYDDIATELNLFMSPQTYRSLIQPHHKRFFTAIRNFGMIPVHHICGRAEICVEDYIDAGAAAWSSVQPTNDIAALLDKYGDRLAFEGGYDTTGKPGCPDVTPEEVVAEVERCFRDYGNKKGFIFAPFLVTSFDRDYIEKLNLIMLETTNRLRFGNP